MPKNRAPVTLLLLAGLFLQPCSTLRAGQLPAALENQPLPSLAPMVETASPAVVNIATSATTPSQLMRDPVFGFLMRRPARKINSLGSGVLVDAAKGYVLTNHHVVNGADEITVALVDGRELKAQIVGSDEDTDLAVIKVDAKNLSALPLADSDQLRVGDFVVAIGNPFGLGHSVTSGIVSALERQGLGIENVENFIQTDAAINPGNSGGALVNLRGELVGINTAIHSPSGGSIGIGFAIPVNIAQQVMQQLIQFGEVRRGLFGASSNDMNAELARSLDTSQTSGAIITRVSPGSPADKAGLQSYDIVIGLNGKNIRTHRDLQNMLGLINADSQLQLDLIRDNKKLSVTVKMSAASAYLNGKSLHEALTGVTLKQKLEGGEASGLEVVSLAQGARAANFGLAKGDIIIGLGRYRLRNADEFRELAKGARSLPLNIQREDNGLLIVIK